MVLPPLATELSPIISVVMGGGALLLLGAVGVLWWRGELTFERTKNPYKLRAVPLDAIPWVPPKPGPMPAEVTAALARSQARLDVEDLAGAEAELLVAEAVAPDVPEVQLALGDVAFARKDYAAAMERSGRAVALAPEHAMARCRRGIARYYGGDHAGALEDLLAAQALDPELPNIETFVAMARKKQGS